MTYIGDYSGDLARSFLPNAGFENHKFTLVALYGTLAYQQLDYHYLPVQGKEASDVDPIRKKWLDRQDCQPA